MRAFSEVAERVFSDIANRVISEVAERAFSEVEFIDRMLRVAARGGSAMLGDADGVYLVERELGLPVVVEGEDFQILWDGGVIRRIPHTSNDRVWSPFRDLGMGLFERRGAEFVLVRGWYLEPRTFRFALPEDDFGFQFALVWEWLVRWYFDSELVELDGLTHELLEASRIRAFRLGGEFGEFLVKLMGGDVVLVEFNLWEGDNSDRFRIYEEVNDAE